MFAIQKIKHVLSTQESAYFTIAGRSRRTTIMRGGNFYKTIGYQLF